MNRVFWERLDALLAQSRIVIDRPRGSHHPRFPQIVYEIDYGYLDGTTSADGEGVDVSLLQNGRMRYLMVVNRSLNRTQRVTVEATEGVMRIMSDGRRIPAARSSPTLAVEAGDMLLFGWEE